MSASESQSLAVPSASAKASTITPMSSVRGSSQALRAGAPVRPRRLPRPAGTGGRRHSVTARPDAAPARPRAPRSARRARPRPPRSPRPPRVPRLQPAWNRGITVRPQPPLDLGALDVHRDVPHAGPDAVREQPDGRAGHRADRLLRADARAQTSPTALSTAPPRTTAAAPHRSIEAAGRGSASTDPAAIASNSRPSAPLSRSSASRTSGTRARQGGEEEPVEGEDQADGVAGGGQLHRPSEPAQAADPHPPFTARTCVPRIRSGSTDLLSVSSVSTSWSRGSAVTTRHTVVRGVSAGRMRYWPSRSDAVDVDPARRDALVGTPVALAEVGPPHHPVGAPDPGVVAQAEAHLVAVRRSRRPRASRSE